MQSHEERVVYARALLERIQSYPTGDKGKWLENSFKIFG